MCYNDCKGLPRLFRGGAGCAGGGQLSRLAERTSGLPERRNSHESPAIRSFPAVLDAAFLLVGRGCPGPAGFAPALTVEEGRPGGVVEVAFPYDGSLGEVAAFRAQVEYDPTVLEHLRPTYGESVQAGTVTTQNTPGKVASVYTAPAGGPYLAGGGRHYLPLPHLGKRRPRPGHGVRLRL